MVSFADYHAFRDFLQRIAPFIKLSFLFLSVTILFASVSFRRNIVRYAYLTTLIIALVVFALLVAFHLNIYNTVYILADFLPESLRVFPPFWIETEKLFFWLLLYLLFAAPVFLFSREPALMRASGVALSLSLLVVSYLDPLSNPLPSLHTEISNLERAANAGISGFNLVTGFYYRVKYFYHSPFMWIHPPLLFISYALFLVSFPLYFLNLLTRSQPEVERLAYFYTAAGYFFLTLGLLLGYPWSVQAWSDIPWWWSPKISVSIVMWLFYTAYLHGRLYRGRTLGRISNLLGILSFASLLFTYASTYIFPGVHSYG